VCFVNVTFLFYYRQHNCYRFTAKKVLVYLCSGGVHYRDKETASWRLSLSGLAIAYNQTGSRYQGPYPKTLKLDQYSHTMTLDYDDGTTSIVVRSRDGFEVYDNLQMVYWYSERVV